MEKESEIELTAMYAENVFLSGQWNYLEQVKNVLIEELRKNPMDIRNNAMLNKVENDLIIISKASLFVNQSLFTHIENKYGGGKKLQYCKTLTNFK